MAGLLEWLSSQKDSATNDYADLMSNYPNAQKFSKGLINAISEHVPTQEDYKSPKKMLDFGMSVANMGMTVKNTNADLLKKYLSTGKLSPKEMAEYEANALKMETPQLQRYNLANAEAQIPETSERMSLLELNTPSYHASRNKENIPEFRNRIAETSLFNGLGVHSGTKESAIQRANNTTGFNRETGKKNPDMAIYYPLQLRANKSFEFMGKPADEYMAELHLDSLGKPLFVDRSSDVAKEAIQDAYFKNNDVLKYINDVEDKGSISYISPPKNIRSRFAAFDPLRKNSSSLLASGLLGSLLLNNEMKNSENK
jgi:hypothetical protein